MAARKHAASRVGGGVTRPDGQHDDQQHRLAAIQPVAKRTDNARLSIGQDHQDHGAEGQGDHAGQDGAGQPAQAIGRIDRGQGIRHRGHNRDDDGGRQEVRSVNGRPGRRGDEESQRASNDRMHREAGLAEQVRCFYSRRHDQHDQQQRQPWVAGNQDQQQDRDADRGDQQTLSEHRRLR
jgi:hypothetical protein